MLKKNGSGYNEPINNWRFSVNLVKKGLLAFSSLLLLNNCNSEVNTTLNQENSIYQSQSREDIGGNVYETFHISPNLPKAKGERLAVKLTYLMNDDEAHQSPWSGKMLLMMDDIQQKNVHNIVFRDGGKIGDSMLYYLQGGKEAEKFESPYSFLADGVTEVQSNNPRLFSRIVEWTFDNFPGKRKYLQIYTHGGGVFGIGMDAHQTDLMAKPLAKEENIHLITPQKFSEALKQGLKGRKLDLVYFRACLMGNMEALYDLRGVVKFVLASEDVSYSKENSNIVMTQMFEDLTAKNTEPNEIAYQMAIQGHGKTGASDGYTTFAAFNMDKIDELKTAINQLALTLKNSLNTEKDEILSAYDAVSTIKGLQTPEKRTEHMRDLWRFTSELEKRVKSSAIKEVIQRVRTAQKNFTIHAKDSLGSSANGLSIFMPFRNSLTPENDIYKFLNANYKKRKFAVDSVWDEFILSLPATTQQK